MVMNDYVIPKNANVEEQIIVNVVAEMVTSQKRLEQDVIPSK